MKPSELAEAMAAAGAPLEAILVALKALEAKDAEIAEREGQVAEKRAKDAARKRAERHAARNVHGQSTDSPETVQANPSLSLPLSPQTPQTPTHTHPDIYPARKGRDFPMLDCTDAETWGDFLRNRKAKRLPNTATARRKLESDLAEVSARTGWPPGEVFAACVAKGWGAIYDPRETTNDRPKQRPSTARETTGETAYRIAAELSQGPGSGEARTYR